MVATRKNCSWYWSSRLCYIHYLQLYSLAFWSSSGPLDIVNIWAEPAKYFGTDSIFGKTNDEIQKNLKKKYNDNGIKILISAFGATQFPTTGGIDPIACANKLAKFVSQNNLDGVDIDWEDNSAMEAGKGQDWLIKFQTELRKGLPNHIITHATQAPDFKQDYYKNGAYVTVYKAVGNTIDFTMYSFTIKVTQSITPMKLCLLNQVQYFQEQLFMKSSREEFLQRKSSSANLLLQVMLRILALLIMMILENGLLKLINRINGMLELCTGNMYQTWVAMQSKVQLDIQNSNAQLTKTANEKD